MKELTEIIDLNLYNRLKNIIQQFEEMENSIKELKNNKLSNTLLEMLGICQSDFYTYIEFAERLEGCESQVDIDELLENSFPDLTVE